MCYKLLKGRYFNPLQLFYVCRGRRKAARVERHVLSTPVYQVSWDSYHGCKVPEAEKYLRSFIVSADFRIVHRQLSTTKRMIRTTQKKSNFSLRFTLRCSNQHLQPCRSISTKYLQFFSWILNGWAELDVICQTMTNLDLFLTDSTRAKKKSQALYYQWITGPYLFPLRNVEWNVVNQTFTTSRQMKTTDHIAMIISLVISIQAFVPNIVFENLL